MRKKVICTLCLLTAACLTGCVEAVDLDEKQEAKFISYSVYSVLEHDNNYMIALNNVDLNDMQEPESENVSTDLPGQTEDNNQVSNGDGLSGNDEPSAQPVAMSEALGLNGVEITYKGLVTDESYPESEDAPAFVIKAVEGKNLYVLEFDMKNTTSSDIAVDLSSTAIGCKGIFNGKVKTAALVTLLPEALNTYEGVIPAGESVKTVLVYEISKNRLEGITDIVLEINSAAGTKSVTIK